LTKRPKTTPADDLKLARAASGGSTHAWHEFVLRYSGLIQAITRRYFSDVDDVRSVHVSVLEQLYRGKLATFRGESTLTTWLVLVIRGVALDQLRKQLGRKELPAGLRRLSEQDQQIYRLYYIEGMSFSAVRHWAAAGGDPLGPEDLAEALARIDRCLDRRVLRRVTYDLHAPSVGAASGRLLQFTEIQQAEREAKREAESPDQARMDREVRRMAETLDAHLKTLSDEERRVLTLRFDKGWDAREIAREMGLESPRRVYTISTRAIRLLRRMLGRRPG